MFVVSVSLGWGFIPAEARCSPSPLSSR